MQTIKIIDNTPSTGVLISAPASNTALGSHLLQLVTIDNPSLETSDITMSLATNQSRVNLTSIGRFGGTASLWRMANGTAVDVEGTLFGVGTPFSDTLILESGWDTFIISPEGSSNPSVPLTHILEYDGNRIPKAASPEDAAVASPSISHTDQYIILGNAGDDTLIGGRRDDTIIGGTGDDSIDGNGGTDTILGEAGDDILIARFRDDQIIGGEGNDTIGGNFGNDTLDGETGDDLILGGRDNDDLTGGAGNDELLGEDNEDILRGAAGNDTLFGGDGDDTLFGGGGSDELIGGLGSDILTGNPGDDLFVYTPATVADAGTELDTIRDFTIGSDLIVLDGLNFSTVSFTAVSGDTLIRNNGDNFALVENAVLSSGDFMIV